MEILPIEKSNMVGKSKIILDTDGLGPGMTIVEAVTLQAEAKITCSEYLCLLLRDEDGNEIRAMFPIGRVGVPAPLHTKMLELYHAGSRFFSLDEIITRQNGEHIVERELGRLVEGEETIEEKWKRKGNRTHLNEQNEQANNKGRLEIPLE